MIHTNLEKYLQGLGKQVMNRAKAGLQSAGKQGALEDSIQFQVLKTSEGYEVFWTMNYYGAFIDKGVSGTEIKRSFTNYQGETLSSPGKGFTNKQPPPEPLEKWIQAKGLKGRDEKSGRYISNRSLAFLIGASIKRKGIPSIMFFQKPLGLAMKTFESQLNVAMSKDLEASIQQANIKF
jgi:hypothetical protein|tara:strand:- start:977 stop:1513 length:537 start_codon:yes stop_codon:yes gene_type:complete